MKMKPAGKYLFNRHLVVALTLSASTAHAGNVGVDLNLHLGNTPQQVVVREPAYQPSISIVVEDDVNFILPGPLGFYVAVGLPYDLFFVNNNYYLFRDGLWFRSHRSQGPWATVRHRSLPPGLRRHKIEQIRHYRDAEYDIYRHDREHYRGKHFRSRKEEWKEEKRQMKMEKHREKEERKHSGDRKRRDD
jgi:hypothetical protein